MRDFDTVEEMNELLIENINKNVKEQDILYHLGDVFFGSMDAADQLMDRINCKSRRLIVGNHDEMDKKSIGFYQKHFQKILVWRIFKDEGLVFSHMPLHPSSFQYRSDGNFFNAHGHVHGNSVRDEHGNLDPRYINMCVENTNYQPINLDEVKTFNHALA